MSTALILRDDQKQTVTFLPTAHELKAAALEQAALIGKVESEEDNALAFAAQDALASVRKQVEKARVEAKERPLELCKMIDAAAKQFVAVIAQEEMRVGMLLSSWHQLQEAKRRAAEQARRDEELRIETERQNELRRIAREEAAAKAKLEAEAAEARRVEAERQAAVARAAREEAAHQARLDAEKAEALRAANAAKTAFEKREADRLAAEVKKRQDEADAQRKANEAKAEAERIEAEKLASDVQRRTEQAAASSHEAFEKANEDYARRNAEIQASAPPEAPAKVQGQRIVSDWDVKVNDVWLLARAHPSCVKMEPLLGEIKTLLNAGLKVVGVTAVQTSKSIAGRSAPKAIDV